MGRAYGASLRVRFDIGRSSEVNRRDAEKVVMGKALDTFKFAASFGDTPVDFYTISMLGDKRLLLERDVLVADAIMKSILADSFAGISLVVYIGGDGSRTVTFSGLSLIEYMPFTTICSESRSSIREKVLLAYDTVKVEDV